MDRKDPEIVVEGNLGKRIVGKIAIVVGTLFLGVTVHLLTTPIMSRLFEVDPERLNGPFFANAGISAFADFANQLGMHPALLTGVIGLIAGGGSVGNYYCEVNTKSKNKMTARLRW